ncbi:MAG TPA: FKBP-type peptidyl-prolyl cis-trans isomerase [Chitinophagaceae bacterium]|nr:FKBP-type peptidyl-prolyl cis-trans isomerase [Chitinophagaceae bacterium]
MPRILFLISFIFLSTTTFSQTTKPVKVSSQKPPAPKQVTPKILKDLRDSASYTAGIHIVNKYRSQNIYNFNGAVVAKACNDLQSNNQQLISNSNADSAVMAYQTQLMADPKKTVKQPVTGVVLNDMRDSASYAAGIYLINFFREFDITNFNPAIITIAINDLQNQKKPLMNDSLANMVAMRYQSKLQEIKNKPTIDAGKKFLTENKKRPGVKVTPSGLQYEIISVGTGKTPTKKDKVSCNYTGAFIDGTEFNNSYKMGGPISFDVNGVIKGWTEALQMMPVGSKWKLYVPYNLAYGPGQYQTIPGGSTLVFEIDLLGIVSN